MTDWLIVQLYLCNQNLNWGWKLNRFPDEPLASISHFSGSWEDGQRTNLETLITTRSGVFWVYRPVKIQRAWSPAAAISVSPTAGQAPSTPPPPGCTCPWAPRPECGVMRAILLSAPSLEVNHVECAEKVQLRRSNTQGTFVWGTTALSQHFTLIKSSTLGICCFLL